MAKKWRGLEDAAGCTPASFWRRGAARREEESSRRERGMLLGGVVLSKGRGTAYICTREEGRDMAAWRATSSGSSCTGISGVAMASEGEVRSRRRRVHSGLLAVVVCRAYEDEADVGVLAGVALWRRPGARAVQRSCLAGVLE